MNSAAPSAAPGERPTTVRHRVLLMLFVTVVINYMDRSNLSVAATSLAHDLALNPVRLGKLLAAFGLAYATLQVPGGWLVDRASPRVLYAVICALWSVATILQGFAGTFLILYSLRLLLGAFEAPAYPICNRVVTAWFPESERAGAIGCYTSGQFVGLAFLTPLLLLAQKSLGWQFVFIITGLAGLVWAGLWFLLYRDPAESRHINRTEFDYIKAGGGLVEAGQNPGAAKSKFSWADLGLILSSRKLWGIYLGQYALTSTLWFFLTWFPTYLINYRHFDLSQSGILSSLPFLATSLPFLAAFAGILCSGFLSDRMVRRGISPTTARKVPIICGLLLSTTIIGANYVEDHRLIILFLALSFFGNGFASITWVLVSLLAPRRLLGLTGGVFNFIGNLSSITVPWIIGHLVSGTNFTPALTFIGGLALLGALSYVFLVGRIERIE
ncbi:MAG TPA: MFS transporter [Opitutaceae bacterium]|jgi:ACS family D-galactonate transporter-like MFS transporter|nr:MFS transporter [Opitutaceae bacterium]